MSVESYRESPGKFDSRTLNRKTLNRWTGRIAAAAAAATTTNDNNNIIIIMIADDLTDYHWVVIIIAMLF